MRLDDPIAALDGGRDGLDAYRTILADVGEVLARGGWLVFEVGQGQQMPSAQSASRRASARTATHFAWLDLAGTARCVALRRP